VSEIGRISKFDQLYYALMNLHQSNLPWDCLPKPASVKMRKLYVLFGVIMRHVPLFRRTVLGFIFYLFGSTLRLTFFSAETIIANLTPQ